MQTPQRASGVLSAGHEGGLLLSWPCERSQVLSVRPGRPHCAGMPLYEGWFAALKKRTQSSRGEETQFSALDAHSPVSQRPLSNAKSSLIALFLFAIVPVSFRQKLVDAAATPSEPRQLISLAGTSTQLARSPHSDDAPSAAKNTAADAREGSVVSASGILCYPA